MKVSTKAMGTVDVPENHVVAIPKGLLGFESVNRYVLIDAEQKPFIWLQSLENQSLAFLLIDPFLICSDYNVEIDDSDLNIIGADNSDDILVLTTVTISADGKTVTTNLQGPLIINKKNNKCIQIILSDDKWQVKHPIFSSEK